MFEEISPDIYDPLFDAMLIIMRLIYIIGCIFCLSLFYRAMMGATAKTAWRKYLVSEIYGAVLLITFYIPVNMPAVAAYGASALAAFLASCIAYNSPKTLKLYTAVTFLAVQYTVFAVGVNLAYALLNIKIFILSGIPPRSPADFLAYLILELIVRAAEILLIYFSVKIISRQFNGINDKLTPIEAASLIIPSCTLLLCLWLIANAGYFSAEDAMGGASAAAGAISLVCIILIAVMFKKLSAAKASEQARALLIQQTAEIKKMYERQKAERENQGKLLHEYRNNIQTIATLAKNGETEELKSFTNKLSAALSIEVGCNASVTGNAVIDSVLNAKLIQAHAADKSLIVNLDVFPNEIETYDLCLILANALDNAIEAQAENGDNKISVNGVNRGGAYILIISNSFSGKLKYKGELPASTKGTDRGFGLINIAVAAKKYNGTINITGEDGNFVLSILLQYK